MRLRTISLVLVFGAFVTIEPSSSGQAQTPAPAAAHAPRRNGSKTASPQVAANATDAGNHVPELERNFFCPG
jgi:hypothetical protein